jgi:hypothetical protein
MYIRYWPSSTNPHYSSNLLKINANAGYPDLVELNFGNKIGCETLSLSETAIIRMNNLG